MKSFARALETTIASSAQYLFNQEQQNKVNSRVNFRLKAIESKIELMFSGPLEAGNPDADLKLLVINIATFLEINIKPDDIRKTRLLIRKSNSDNVSTNPPPIIATLYSSSKRLKLLDPSKNIKKKSLTLILFPTQPPRNRFLLIQCYLKSSSYSFKNAKPGQK